MTEPQLPEPITGPIEDMPSGDELPELPPGYVWGLKITAETEVIRADGTKEP